MHTWQALDAEDGDDFGMNRDMARGGTYAKGLHGVEKIASSSGRGRTRLRD